MEAWLQQDLQILSRVVVAMLLGGLIGLERETRAKPAGLRTHMLVAGAAALIVGLGDVLAGTFMREDYAGILQVDPVRLIEAVIACVGFIGAGTILRSASHDHVLGLTTAVSLLMAASIGIATGLGRYGLGIGVVVLSLLVLVMFSWLERRLPRSAPPGEPD